MNEYVEDGVFKTVFVMSADNDNSILKKDLGAELHEKVLKQDDRYEV